MEKNKWIQMAHSGHFIAGESCRFRLNTYVGKYIVSTIGELLFDSNAREIIAKSRGVTLKGKGDFRKADYMKKIGYEEVGMNRKYETMVFRARESKNKCCPYEIIVSKQVDFKGYNTPDEAFSGHNELCEKWSKK